MKPLSIAYFGSSYFSARLLEKLLTDKTIPIEVKLVVTQPDKPVGRKQIMTATQVKIIAEKYKIPITVNSKCKMQKSKLQFKIQNIYLAKRKNFSSSLNKIDLALVYAYGKIIPAELLKIPKFGFWNIHSSLLPKYRGPSPIAYPIINADTETGVTLIQMDEEIDHGPIIDQIKCLINPNEKRPDLEKKLTNLGYELFKKNINQLTSKPSESEGKPANQLTYKSQDHTKASFTKLLTKQDGFIKFEQLKKILTSNSLLLTTFYNRFRGLYPWPGIWTLITINGQEKRLKITDMCLLQINRVQLEGKKEVDFKTFQKAYSIY